MTLWPSLLRILHDLLDFLLPACCSLCTAPLEPNIGTGFCTACQQRIPPLPAASCRRCALPYPSDLSDDHLCGICLAERNPPFERVLAAGIYDAALREAIHRFKYRGKINLDRPLADLLMISLSELEPPDLIMPVPLHNRRLRQRTYNQSALLARLLAKNLDRPLVQRQLVRHRDTPQQQGQNAAERKQNLKDAFAVIRPLNGETILLVDDVLTTGATVRACCQTLKNAGAGAITIAVLARARAV